MLESALLESVKTDLRISHSKLDGDILENVNAARLDMKRLGVDADLDNDLVKKAIKLYVRWQYNFENQADRYMNAYQDMILVMSMAKDYKDKGV